MLTSKQTVKIWLGLVRKDISFISQWEVNVAGKFENKAEFSQAWLEFDQKFSIFLKYLIPKMLLKIYLRMSSCK